MYLKSIFLQNFRNYKKAEFDFSAKTTFIVGANTSGKTNLIEAIYFLSFGRSFRAEKDKEAISFGEKLARITGLVDDLKLEAIITEGINANPFPFKKYLINGVSKRQVDFIGNLPAVLFIPTNLDIIVDSPTTRRNFLDDVLEQTDRDYRLAQIQYVKVLRQRNALLEKAKEQGFRNDKVFEYWDEVLIRNGEVITQKRAEFIEFVNSARKEIFDFVLFYDKSVISKERLLKYKDAEAQAGVTLVGPHRDDFSVSMFNNIRNTTHDVKLFGSRGQQRLTVLQLKIIQLDFIERTLGGRPALPDASRGRPILLLDDIFSELDSEHIDLISSFVNNQQTIITTTHQEFIPKKLLAKSKIINLDKTYSMI